MPAIRRSTMAKISDSGPVALAGALFTAPEGEERRPAEGAVIIVAWGELQAMLPARG